MAAGDDESDRGSAAEGTSIEALRRRVYGPGATAEDRERLAEANAALVRTARRPAPARAAGAAPAVEDPPIDAAPRRPVARRALVVGGIAAAAAGVLALVAALSGVLPEPVPAPVAPTVIGVSGEDRAGFVEDLQDGGAAGLAAYLVTHPSPPSLRDVVDPATVERQGIGTATLEASRPAGGGEGRVSVLLVLEEGGDAGWTVEQLRGSGARDAMLHVTRGGRQEAGVPTVATVRLPSPDTPVRLAVRAPDGVRWGVALVFSR